MTPTLTDFGDNELEFIMLDSVYELCSYEDVRRSSIEDFFGVLLPNGPANFPVFDNKEDPARIAMAILKGPEDICPRVRSSASAKKKAKRLRITTTPEAIQQLDNNFPEDNAVLHGPKMAHRRYLGDLKEWDAISNIRNVPSSIAKEYLPKDLFKANKPHQDVSIHSLAQLKRIASQMPSNAKIELTAYRGLVNLLVEDNVQAMSGLVLDCDEPGAIEQAKALFAEQYYIIASSHSYSEEKPYKARMFLPFEKPIQAEVLKEYTRTLTQMNFDTAVNTFRQLYSMPATQPEQRRGNVRPIAEVNYGSPLNESTLEKVVGRTQSLNHASTVLTKKASQQFMGADGKLYSKSALLGELKFDYASMKKRHRFAMKHLQENQERDAFAYQVIKREMNIAGDRLSLRHTVVFIHAACADPEYSNKSLCDPSSDTAAALPEKFTRLIGRNPSYIGIDPSQINQEIKRHIREAQALSKKGGLALLSSAMEGGSPAPKPPQGTEDPKP